MNELKNRSDIYFNNYSVKLIDLHNNTKHISLFVKRLKSEFTSTKADLNSIKTSFEAYEREKNILDTEVLIESVHDGLEGIREKCTKFKNEIDNKIFDTVRKTRNTKDLSILRLSDK